MRMCVCLPMRACVYACLCVLFCGGAVFSVVVSMVRRGVVNNGSSVSQLDVMVFIQSLSQLVNTHLSLSTLWVPRPDVAFLFVCSVCLCS